MNSTRPEQHRWIEEDAGNHIARIAIVRAAAFAAIASIARPSAGGAIALSDQVQASGRALSAVSRERHGSKRPATDAAIRPPARPSDVQPTEARPGQLAALPSFALTEGRRRRRRTAGASLNFAKACMLRGPGASSSADVVGHNDKLGPDAVAIGSLGSHR